MRYLLTGGAGFVGSHLADALLARGDSVVVIDDLSTGSIDNIRHLKGTPRFAYVLETVLNRSVMAEVVDEADVIVHLAAAVGVRLIVESPVRTIETNVRGTELVLELAAKKKKRVIVFSTSEVYGKSSAPQFSETDDLVLGPTTKGRWSYAASKIVDEFLALAYWKEKGLPVVIVRLFNTVGPRQTGRYGMVIPRFVDQALRGQPITVFGDGRQTRTFVHVKDVVSGVLGLVDNRDAVGEIFNIGGYEEVSIGRLAQLVKEIAASPSPISFIPYDEAYEEGFEDMRRRAPDITKIQKFTGYVARRGLREIIADVISYQQEKLARGLCDPPETS